MAKNVKYNNTLEGLIEAAKKFNNGEWSQETIAEYGEHMIIKTYLPMMEKIAGIMRIMTVYLYDDESSPEFKIAELHKLLFFYGLLQQYGCIDCSNKELITYENYDLLYPLYHPFITSYCKEDYELYKEILKDSVNYTNVQNFLGALEGINEEALSKATEANAKMLSSFSTHEELIEKLNNIAIMNDPTTAKVVDELKNMALRDALNKASNERK